jgi:GT2 family glycosyltransferase
MLTIDIIIVNYNSTKYLIACLNSIYRHLINHHVTIQIEDNETDGSIDIVEKEFRGVKIERNIKNIGFGAAINQALRRCKSPYVLILNPDTVLIDGSLYGALDFMNKNARVGVIGPKVLEPDGSVQGSARKFPTPWTSLFGRKSPLTKLYPNNPFTKREFLCYNCNGHNEIDVDWVSGACMLIRREAINQVGAFDERFFLYWEDADLCRRMQDAYWRVVYYPKSQVTHLVGKSSDTKPITSAIHFHHSCYKLFDKHTKFPIRLMMPIAFLALSLRCLFVSMLTSIRRILK